MNESGGGEPDVHETGDTSTADVRITKIATDALEFPSGLTSFPNNFAEQEMDDITLDDDSRANNSTPDVENLTIKVIPENTISDFHDNVEREDHDLPVENAAPAQEELVVASPKRSHEPVTIKISRASDDPESVSETTSINEEKDLSVQLEHTTVIHSTEETTEDTFRRLKDSYVNGVLSQKEIIDGLFNVLVGGPFDLESRFIIEYSENIEKMLEFIDMCPNHLQAEIWSVFVAVVRKSFRNLEACSRVGLISKCLDRLFDADSVTSDLLIQLLCVLTNYGITVKETKRVLRALEARNGVWNRNSAKLLTVMKEMPKREGADVFFSFPGKASAGIALPPLNRWPYQNGWTFSTWFRMDPLNSVNFEKETPYLFSFGTSKGLGYYCYFMGSCLVLKVVKASNKEITKCIKHELTPRKWHHVALSYSYSRWAKSEIFCYIDGQMVESVDASWLVNTNEHFNRCFIGCGNDADANEAFCGQMAAIYVFSQAITLQQATCLYCLGASYQSHFKHDAESNLPDGYKKHLFDGRLNSSLVFAYCPKNYHGQLCLFSPPSKSQTSYFVQVPHAIMKNGVEVVTTHSIHNSLHSVGGIQMLLPLFAQIDMPHLRDNGEMEVDYEICATLLSVISLLLSTSASAQQQLFHSQGFLIIAHVLNTSSKDHLSAPVLELFIAIAKFLQTCSSGLSLLKQLFDHIFFTAQLWIRTDSTIQLRLYNFLANEFFANANFVSVVRRTQTVIGLMHTLKVYYYIVAPRANAPYKVCAFENAERLDRASIVHIRGHILQLINKLMFSSSTAGNASGNLGALQDEKEWNRDEEFQCIFNYISTVTEDDNLYDVLNQAMRQMCDHPAVMVPAFDRKGGACVIFKLAASGNELIRLPALKMFGYYLCRSTVKRKNESINHLNLLHLLAEKILENSRSLSLVTYNVLFELLTEQICAEILFVRHEELPPDSTRFENPAMLKVIAGVIIQSEECAELLRVKKVFLTDLITLCRDSRENRRVILQMSVWQEWLISLAYVFPQNAEQEEVTDLVYQLFAILLFHAIRLEYGGWRVWVDTLAIAHSKVSWQRYRRKLANRRGRQQSQQSYDRKQRRGDGTGKSLNDKNVIPEENELSVGEDDLSNKDAERPFACNTDGSSTTGTVADNVSNKDAERPFACNTDGSSTTGTVADNLSKDDLPSSLYRTPDFVWSHVHIRLLNDLLSSIESVVDEWLSSSTLLIDYVNNSDNQVFISNAIHVLSQLIDSLIMACGGLLPLLAAATAPNDGLRQLLLLRKKTEEDWNEIKMRLRQKVLQKVRKRLKIKEERTLYKNGNNENVESLAQNRQWLAKVTKARLYSRHHCTTVVESGKPFLCDELTLQKKGWNFSGSGKLSKSDFSNKITLKNGGGDDDGGGRRFGMGRSSSSDATGGEGRGRRGTYPYYDCYGRCVINYDALVLPVTKRRAVDACWFWREAGAIPSLLSSSSPPPATICGGELNETFQSELDITDSTQQDLSIEHAVAFLQRFAELADVFVFISGVNFGELEHEKNMPNGGILRQSLRLVSTMAVRNILACRVAQKDRGFSESSMNSREKYDAIVKFVGNALDVKDPEKGIVSMDSLLQPIDLKRLKGVIYRDMEEGRHAQFLALSVVYLLSVLMVSRYRDILEPPTSPSPFFDTNSDSSARRKSVESSPSLKKSDSISSSAPPLQRQKTLPSSYKSGSVRDAVGEESDELPAQEQLTNGRRMAPGESKERDLSLNNGGNNDGERKVEAKESNDGEHLAVDDADDGAFEEDEEEQRFVQQHQQEVANVGGSPSKTQPHQQQKEARQRQISAIHVAESGDNDVGAVADDREDVDERTTEGGNGDNVEEGCGSGGREKYDTNELSRFNTSITKSPADAIERRQYLTQKLQKALESAAPLLREIMTDFRSFLQKTLLGTHGQEIMNDAKVMQSLKSQQGSVIELVMLLCSQEWQTSLQKHAGLAFIELVNEGRLMAHATRDHILRVANEADFILKRLRAEDVSKHAQFEKDAAVQLSGRRRDEQVSDHLRHSTKRREFLMAVKLLEKMRTILWSPSGAWSADRRDENLQTFWRLDLWEDDSRRRKRFVPNVYGCRHALATLKEIDRQSVSSSTDEAKAADGTETDKAHEQLLKDLAHKMNVFSSKSSRQNNVENGAELVDESDIDKWASEETGNDLRDSIIDQASYSTPGKLIAPGVVVPGTISITSTDVYFDADEEDPLYKQQDPRCLRFCDNLHGRWHFQEIRAIFLRRYALQYVALELFLASRTAIMFAFGDQETVKHVVDHLPRVGVGVKYGLPQSRKASLMSPRQLFKHSDMPQKWQRREISNFDYLMFLNTIAGRTYNDLNQYPVFPWIISNYNSDKLDLGEASNFRDLSKPVGALSETRKKYFQERFNNWDDESVPAFHYGTHYSTQAFTLNWLFRVEPFMTFFLSLQSGKFDHSDRLFHSLAETWEHCQRDTHDVKELIPELFYLPEMFSNSNAYQLGRRQEDGVAVNDVILPPWAKSPEHFVMMHRQALESDLVSCQLNQWIDLIFGYKQRGPEAVRATNVFYYLTYEGSVELDALDGPLREGVQQQILNFGQTPVQLMTDPHPPRHSIMTMSPLMFQPCNDDLCMLMKFISNSAVVHITANTFPQLTDPTVLSISQNLIFALNRWNPNFNQSQSQTSGALSSSLAAEKSASNGDGSGANNMSSAAASGGGNAMSTAELPLTVDPLLAVGNPSQPPQRRHMGDAFDQRLCVSWSNFCATADSRFIFACGYPDYSFRLIETENATVRQVIYGHGDVVTCLARSEMSLFADCYVASGGLDCTVVLWHFSHAHQAIAGEYNLPGEAPSPRAILTGHDAEITAICVSAEHGVVVSGSRDGTVLMHTTHGDLLRHIVAEAADDHALGAVTNLLLSRDCHLAVFYDHEYLATFTTSSGRQLNRPLHRSAEKVLCGVLSRDGEYIVLGTSNGRISVLRLFPLQLLYTFPQTDSPTRCVAISTNQRLIFGGLESGAIVVFNVDFNKWHYEYKQRYSYR